MLAAIETTNLVPNLHMELSEKEVAEQVSGLGMTERLRGMLERKFHCTSDMIISFVAALLTGALEFLKDLRWLLCIYFTQICGIRYMWA